MITALPPPRSIDDADAPASLRSALAAGRDDIPSSEQLARMAERLGIPAMPASHAGPAAQTDTGSPTSVAASALSIWGRRAFVPVLALLCALGGWSLHATLGPAPETPHPAPQPLAAPAIAAQVTVAPPVAIAAEQTQPTPKPQELTRTSEPRPRKPAPLPVQTAPAQAEPAQAAPVQAALDPNAELALLERARAQLTPAPRRALALAEEHARRFPNGLFQEERELIAIVGLLSIGDLANARARAGRFDRAFPASVHKARLDSLFANHKDDARAARRGVSATGRPNGED